jgi:hypothetical protein
MAQYHPPHEHGAAKLNVIIEGDEVELLLDSPLINLIPFERAPGTPAETEDVKKMSGLLNAPKDLFIFTPAAGCAPKGQRFYSPPLEASLLPANSWPEGREDSKAKADAAEGDHDHEDEGDHDHDAEGDHEHAEEGDHEHGEEGEHNDILVEYIFSCAKPAELKDIDSRLQEKFPSFTRIDTQIIAPSGQKSVTLEKGQTKITW